MVSSTKWNHIKFFTSQVFHLPKQIESNKVNQKISVKAWDYDLKKNSFTYSDEIFEKHLLSKAHVP